MRRLLPRPRRARIPAPHVLGDVVVNVVGAEVRLGGAPVVRNVSLTVRSGEVLALVGPNGAGKSTLLSAMAGDLPVEQGDITIGTAPLSSWTPIELALRRAVLPQKITLSFPFQVIDVVEMGRAPWIGTPCDIDDDLIVAEAMRKTAVTEFASRRFHSLSGGEQARVALARVLAQQAGAIFLDEPTAALDLRHQELVLRVVRERAAAGDAVVVVLHDLNLAAAHADRIAVMSAGELVAWGPAAEVLTSDLLSTVYRHEVEVIEHPRTGTPLVLPRR